MKWKPLLVLLAAIFLIKISFYFLDSRPAYFLGDSQAYLATATIKYIPPDRGFAYGLLLRRIGVHMHSLAAVVQFQILLSGITAWLVAIYLVRFFSVRVWIASVASLLCALEPLQLLMERFIMTETTSTFLFAVYLGLVLQYVRRGHWGVLAGAQAVAILLLSIRLSFLPEILINSALIPFLSPKGRAFAVSLLGLIRKRLGVVSVVEWKAALGHLVLSLALMQSLLISYEHLNGFMQKAKPALLYANGYFLLADLLPMVKPEDYPIAWQRQALFANLKYDPKLLKNRLTERWFPGELCNRIELWWPHNFEGNQIASTTAMNAIKRDPMGLLRIAWQEFRAYFDVTWFKQTLLDDEGAGPALPVDFVEQLVTRFNVRDPKVFEPSLTKSWHRFAMPWYWIVLCSPPLWGIVYFLRRPPDRSLVVVCLVAAFLFLEGATLTVERPNARYLATAAWLELLLVGLMSEIAIPGARPTATSVSE